MRPSLVIGWDESNGPIAGPVKSTSSGFNQIGQRCGRQPIIFPATLRASAPPMCWPVPPLEALVRSYLARDETVAGLVRAIGCDPEALDPRAVRDIAAVLRRLAATTPRYRCANCGFSSIGHFWQCPACKNWDSQRPLLRFDLVAGLDKGRGQPPVTDR